MADHVIKLMDLEKRIKEIIKSDNNCNVYFEYSDSARLCKAYTINPLHKETFLLYSKEMTEETEVERKLSFLGLLFDYVKQTLPSPHLLSYSVVWSKDGKFNTSYFLVRDMKELVNKFYAGKNTHDYIIQRIEQNPIS